MSITSSSIQKRPIYRCCVRDCNSISNETDFRFYRIPKICKRPKEAIPSAIERQKRWLKAINNHKINLKKSRVCSRHFISGKHATLLDSTNPDWVPNLHLGEPGKHDFIKAKVRLCRYKFRSNSNVNKPRQIRARSSRKTRYKSAIDLVNADWETDDDSELVQPCGGDENLQISDNETFSENNNIDYDEPNMKFVPVKHVQTFLSNRNTIKKESIVECNSIKDDESGVQALKLKTKEEIYKEAKEKEELFQSMLNAYEQRIKDLDYELNQLKFNVDLRSNCIDSLRFDDEKVRSLTGLQNFTVLSKLYDVIKDSLNDHSTTGITQFNSFVITLMKLRMDLPIAVLAYFFRISPHQMGKIYLENLSTMNSKIGPLVKWPDDKTLLSCTPDCFKEVVGDKCVILIHFLEIILKNLNPTNSSLQYTKHKLRYLIAFTPSGEIIFVSQGFGNKSSNEDIIKESGFFDQISENHVFLSVKEMFDEAYMENEEVQSLKHIARQTEMKVLDVLKDNFRILFNRQAANFHGEVYSEFTVRCCCALANLQMPEFLTVDTEETKDTVLVFTK